MIRALLTGLIALTAFGCGADDAPKAPEPQAAQDSGLEQAFIGTWRAAKPEGEGVIVNVPRAGCDDPVIITSPAIDMIEYTSPLGSPVEFELFAFDDRITWYPSNAPTSIAEVKDVDVFWLYATNGIGKADWDNPLEYRRCESGG